MESVSYFLQPYKDLVGEIAVYVTIAQFFAGIPVCKDIYQRGSTKGLSAIPFLGGLTLGILMFKYGLILSDPASIKVNLVAIILNTLYVLVYYFYSGNRIGEIFTPLGYCSALVAVLLGYAEVENPENIEFRFGLIVSTLLLLLIGSPLFGVKEIISKQDASNISFLMTFMSTLVSIAWLLYGIILQNILMVVPNIIGLLLCLIQLGLIVLYSKSASSKSSKKKKKKSKKD